MVAGPFTFYNDFHLRIGDGTWDLDAATPPATVMLVLSASNFATLTNNVYGDLTSEVANGNGYATGGQTVPLPTWTRSAGVAKFTGSAVLWTPTTGSLTCRAAVLYGNATSNGVVKPLVGFQIIDNTPADTVTALGAQLILTPTAAGMFTLTG